MGSEFPVNTANINTGFGLTGQSVLGISGFVSADTGAPTRDIMPTTHINETLSWIHGAHSLSFGFELYRNRVNELQNWQSGGNIQFTGSASGNAAADFLLGKFDSYRQVTGLTSRLRQTLPSLFVQDDWRVSRRITLNLGLRWEPYNGYVSEDNQLMLFAPGKQSTVFPKAPAGLLFPGDAGVPSSVVGSRWNNIAPRVGIAWDVFGDGKTSIRTGRRKVLRAADTRNQPEPLHTDSTLHDRPDGKRWRCLQHICASAIQRCQSVPAAFVGEI